MPSSINETAWTAEPGYEYITQNGFIEVSHVVRNRPFSMDHFHVHDHYELYYLIQGNRKYIIDNRQYDVNPGDLVLIRSQVEHKTIDSGRHPHQRFLLAIKPFEYALWPEMQKALELSFSDKYAVIPHTNIVSLELKHIIERIIFLSRSDEFGSDLLIHTLVIQMLIYIAKYRKKTGDKQLPDIESKSDLVARAIKYIENNYHRQIKIHDIANALFVSHGHLCRLFKISTGNTLNDYLNSLRVEKARYLLLETRLPVNDIAGKTGFGSISQFNRQMKQRLQISPLRYRKFYAQR